MDPILGQFDMHVDRLCSSLASNAIGNDPVDQWGNLIKNRVHAAVMVNKINGTFPVSPGPLYTNDIKRKYSQNMAPYIVTLMDKNSANFVLVCKKYYFQCVLQDLYGAVLPTHPPPPPNVHHPLLPHLPPPAPPTSIPPHGVAPQHIAAQYYQPIALQQLKAALHTDHHFLSRWDLHHNLSKRPAYYFATVKCHKNPPQLRFVAASHNTPLTKIGHVCTAVLKLVAHEYREIIWPNTFPLYPTSRSWFCLDSGAIMHNVHAFNQSQSPTHTPMHPSAWDFTRMYTNIPQDLLLDKICLIFQRCFNQPHGTNTGPKYNAIEVTVQGMDHSSTGRFISNWNAAHPPLFTEQKQVTYTFNEVELRRLFYIMIRHTYIQFGDRYFHQIVY
jgi:hypothetical protein